jgi:hypothetical protein
VLCTVRVFYEILHFSKLLVISPSLSHPLFPSPDSSYVQYSGNSYLEFEGIDLGANNNITVRFQTQEAQGTILYVDQGAVTRGFFFMKLFIQEGMLQVRLFPEYQMAPYSLYSELLLTRAHETQQLET